MSRCVIDASLCLGWYLKDEQDRTYDLDVLAQLAENDAVAPLLWAYEVLNALVMALRRKRITNEDIAEIIATLTAVPITVDYSIQPEAVFDLTQLALKHDLTVYDAAYLELALRKEFADCDQGRGPKARHGCLRNIGCSANRRRGVTDGRDGKPSIQLSGQPVTMGITHEDCPGPDQYHRRRPSWKCAKNSVLCAARG